jgi:hypothetical protein
MSKLETRAEILIRVRRGEMSTKAAEKWAAENHEIFSTRPNPGQFDPMAEPQWTLPMAAAWIIERSRDAVREHWDSYRSGFRRWVSCEGSSPDGRKQLGLELREVGPSNLFEVFGSLGSRESGALRLARELSFALKSGQLSASGVSQGQESRSEISKRAWRGPFPSAERKKRHDAIYADAADIDDDSDDEVLYDKIQVPRDGVIGIWQPLTPTSKVSSATDLQETPTVRLVATLPPGFDGLNWGLEHVLAWLPDRDLAKLRTLELADSRRPEWYGKTYRHGLIDAPSENILREALIAEDLVAIKRERPVLPGRRWYTKSFPNTPGVWFQRAHVLDFWPANKPPAHRGGRPPAVDWTIVKTEALRLMDYHGDFGADSPEWNVQARLEDAIEAFCETRLGKLPGKTTIQEHISPWLAEWRAKRRPPES